MGATCWDVRSLKKRVGASDYPQQVFHSATRYYVPPLGQDTDPSVGEFGADLATTKSLTRIVDEFLERISESRFLVILGGAGTGKTTFLLNYYARHCRRWRPKFDVVLLPFGVPDFDARLNSLSGTNKVLLLDAFDEDTLAIKDHTARLEAIALATRGFEKVVLTCRTQFFPIDEEKPNSTVATVSVGAKGMSQRHLHKKYISPLTDQQIQRYIRYRFSFWSQDRGKAKALVARVPRESARPMVLAYLQDLIDSGESPPTIDLLYEAVISAWLRREVGILQEFTSVDAEGLREFSEKLAVDIWLNRNQRGAERVQEQDLRTVADRWRIPLEDWKLTGRSLLSRDVQGNWKFAHRSFMEFLCVQAMLKEPPLGVSSQDLWKLTDLMKQFLCAVLRRDLIEGLKLSGADLSGANLTGANLSGADLSRADLSEADLTGANLSGANLNRANLGGARPIGADLSRANLGAADLSAANLTAANLLAANFRGANLRGAVLPKDFGGADLSEADFGEADFGEADLGGANLSGAKLIGANLGGADLTSAFLKRADLRGADLSAANLTAASLTGAVLEYANLSAANLTAASLTGAVLEYANLTRAHLNGANLIGADLRWAKLGWADLSHAKLSNANLSEANLTRANFGHANLSQAILSGAHLIEAKLIYANLSDASLDGANLGGALLTGAFLTRADLRGAAIHGAKDVTESGIFEALLDAPQLTFLSLEFRKRMKQLAESKSNVDRLRLIQLEEACQMIEKSNDEQSSRPPRSD